MFKKLFQLISKYRHRRWAILLYWFTRISMSLTFVTSGIRKLPGVKFTLLGPDNPVGAYFIAMHNTGFYWNFIGYLQIVLGLMILINRLKVITPLVMMPVTINIFLISVSLGMRGTPVITTAMVLANIFLMFWCYENYLPLLQKNKELKI
ncbi:MAG: hypothetical protein ABJR05_08040 [Balneola sp.]